MRRGHPRLLDRGAPGTREQPRSGISHALIKSSHAPSSGVMKPKPFTTLNLRERGGPGKCDRKVPRLPTEVSTRYLCEVLIRLQTIRTHAWPTKNAPLDGSGDLAGARHDESEDCKKETRRVRRTRFARYHLRWARTEAELPRTLQCSLHHTQSPAFVQPAFSRTRHRQPT